MSFTLPYPNTPQNGQTGDAVPINANFTAISQGINSFDGSQIQANSVTETALANAINPRLRYSETLNSFVYTGCTWSVVSGLQGTMTGGTIYVGGYRVVVTGVGSQTFTASQDTYVDIDQNGNVTYPSVSNNATAPALTANSLRVAKVITNGSAITSVVQSGVDSNNVPIYPTSSLGLNAWKTWPVTFTNISVGNGTATARYLQVGKIVFYKLLLTWGSTTSMTGAGVFSLPVTSTAVLGTLAATPIGQAMYTHGASLAYQGFVIHNSTTTGNLRWYNVAGAAIKQANLGATSPDTWATGDEFHAQGFYEAA